MKLRFDLAALLFGELGVMLKSCNLNGIYKHLI
jgi:hypothetical protein